MVKIEDVKKNSIWTPPHAHLASGSIGDSILKTKEYVKRAKEYGHTHLVMTDHGSLSSMYNFSNECKKHGIIPIIGIEMYEAPDRFDKASKRRDYNHLVLLAKNYEGMQNLFILQNDAAINGQYYEPRTDMTMLRKHGKGIIALSACLGGTIPQAILKEDPEEAIRLIQGYKECFDEFYLEIQPGSFNEQLVVNDALVELAEYTNTPLIASNDIHYLEKDDYLVHDAHVRLSRKMKIQEDGKLLYPDTIYWFMDRETVANAFKETKYVTREVIENSLDMTMHVANQCDLQLSSDVYMPKFAVPEGITEEELLTRVCFERLNKIIYRLNDPASYVQRLLYELDTISKLGFCGYFLIVYDFIEEARRLDIAVGPGRGSVAGSLTAYILGFSLADPIKYDLMFERFLSPYRTALPDIDSDFCSQKRNLIFDYIATKYGNDNVALVSTLGIRKAKSSLRDTARVLGLELEIGDRAAKLIPSVYYSDDGEKTTDLDIATSIEITKELAEMQIEYPELFKMAMKLEGLPCSSGIHAAGIVISPVSLDNLLPLIPSNKEGIKATSLNLEDAENVVVKFDMLGLATLSVIQKTEKDVGFVFDHMNEELLADENVWNLIGSRNTTGLFQISSKTYRDRMPRLKPKSIQDLAACLALVRGPCISSGADKVYMEIVEGKRQVDIIHLLYYKATQGTNGILIYQESLMQILVNFGFDLETAYKILKIVAKKKMDLIKEYESKFMKKAIDLKVPREIANKIWKIIFDAGLYAFNSGHATSYALLSFSSAYLKYHYPKEYMVNLLTNVYERGMKEAYSETIDECRRLGIQFLPLDINKSNWEFKLEDGSIRIGMCAVRSFGEVSAQEVVLKRPFLNLSDFLEKIENKKCNKRGVNVAIFSGMFDDFNQDKIGLYNEFVSLRKEKPEEEISIGGKDKLKVDSNIAVLEETLLGGKFLSDPANQMEPIGFNDFKINFVFQATVYIRAVKKHKDTKGNNMAFLTLSTGDGAIDCTVFSNTYEKYKKLLKKNTMCLIKAKKDNQNSCILQMAE